MAINRSFWSNINGVPRIEADTVTVSSTAATYNFDARAYVPVRYSGLILFKLPAYEAPATAVPVIFNTAGSNSQALTFFGGEAITSADLNRAGIILAYYENSTLQVLSYIPTPTATT